MTTHGKQTLILCRQIVVTAAIACFSATEPAQANGTNPVVIEGQASFSNQGSSLNITNTPGTIINWQGFSIGTGETTRFIQQNGASSVLNRVLGSDPSVILGTLTSNGRVFLINPGGILFGQGSHIDVSGLVASTLALSNKDFLAGRLDFTANPCAGAVENRGSITTPSGGSVYLVGSNVTNSGVINSPQGNVILAAGQSVRIFDTSTPGVRVEITANDNSVVNLGEIMAQSGEVGIYGAALRNSGIINADQVVRDGSGRIFLRAKRDVTLESGSHISANGGQAGEITVQSENDTTLVSGTIEAKGTEAGQSGGNVQLLGDRVGLVKATVDVSGAAGGGTVLIGGDYQGKSPSVQNSTATYVSSDSSINTDALKTGDGGKVIVWANDQTRFLGNISARGGVQSGNGGFVEVSGKHYLDFRGMVDTRAPMGLAGTLFLDPDEIQIINAAGGAALYMTCSGGGDCTTPTAGGPYLDVAAAFISPAYTVGILPDHTINQQLALGNVTVQTSTGGILISNVNSTVTLGPSTGAVDVVGGNAASNTNTLTLNSATYISWNAPWSYRNSGQISLLANNGSIDGTGALTLAGVSPLLMQAATNIGSVATPMAVSGGGGNVTFTAGTSSDLGTIDAGAGTISATSSGSGDITVSGALTNTNPGTSAVVLDSTSGTGNVTFSGGSISTPGRATIFTNSVAGSSGVTALVGSGSGNFRYNGVTTGLGSGIYAVYTEQPFLTITATNDSKIYGADDPAQSFATVTGYMNGDTAGLTGMYARTAGESVGSRSITQGTIASDVGYGISFTGGQNLTITSAPLTGTIVNQTKTYGTVDPALPPVTLSGIVNRTASTWNGAVAVNDSGNVTATVASLTRTTGEVVSGSPYTITGGTLNALTGSAAGNYTGGLNTAGNTLSITPATLAIAANSQTKVYGTDDPMLTFAIVGLVNNPSLGIIDTPVSVFSGVLSRAGGESVPGGPYAITLGTLAANSNYTLDSFTGNSLIITPLAITGSITATNKIYDGTAAATIATRTLSGALGSDTVSYSGGTAFFSDKNAAASKTVSGSGLVLTGADAGNYTVNGTATTTANITPAPLSVTAGDETRLYGHANPAFSATYSGLKNGESAAVLTGALTFTTPAVPASNVGNYAVIPNGQSSTNYTVSYGNGSLRVTPVPLMVTADAKSKIFGASDPPLTFGTSGLVNNPTLGVVDSADSVLSGSLTRTPGESALGGPYKITQGSLTANSNYTLGYTSNNLIITGAAAEPILGFSADQVVFAGVINNEFYYRPGNFWHISLNPNNADPGFDVMRGTNDLNARVNKRMNRCDSVFGGGMCETWSFPQQFEKIEEKK